MSRMGDLDLRLRYMATEALSAGVSENDTLNAIYNEIMLWIGRDSNQEKWAMGQAMTVLSSLRKPQENGNETDQDRTNGRRPPDDA